MNLPEDQKIIVDAISIGVGVSSLLAWLPHIAAALTIIWTLIRIFETRTVQRLLGLEYRRRGDIPEELEHANDER